MLEQALIGYRIVVKKYCYLPRCCQQARIARISQPVLWPGKTNNLPDIIGFFTLMSSRAHVSPHGSRRTITGAVIDHYDLKGIVGQRLSPQACQRAQYQVAPVVCTHDDAEARRNARRLALTSLAFAFSCVQAEFLPGSHDAFLGRIFRAHMNIVPVAQTHCAMALAMAAPVMPANAINGRASASV